MQGKIRAVPTLVYPESDGKPMAETDAHRSRCLYSQNPQMPNARIPNAICLGRVLASSRPAMFAFSGTVSIPHRPSRPALFAFLGIKTPPPPSTIQIISAISAF